MKKLIVVPVLLLSFMFAACNSWEQNTFNTLATTQAVLTEVANDYNAGTIPKTQTNHDLILKAQEAKDVAVNAMVVYEEAKASAVGPNVLTADENAVITALSNLTPLISSVRVLVGSAPATKPVKQTSFNTINQAVTSLSANVELR